MWKTRKNRAVIGFFFHNPQGITVFFSEIIHIFCGKLPSRFHIRIWYSGIENEVPAWKTSKKSGKKLNQSCR